MYNHPPNAGSMVLGFIRGFSLGVIPAYGTDQYTQASKPWTEQARP
jgi:hypothetical protein